MAWEDLITVLEGISNPWSADVDAAGYDLDNMGDLRFESDNGTYGMTLRMDDFGYATWTMDDPSGNNEYGIYFYTLDVGVYDGYVTSPSDPPETGDGNFGGVHTIWSTNDYEIGGWGFYGDAGNMDFFNGIYGGNLRLTTYTDGGGTLDFELDPDAARITSEYGITVPGSGSAATPDIAFGDGDSGFYENSDDLIGVSIAGTTIAFITNASLRSATSGGFEIATSTGASYTVPKYRFRGDDNTGIARGAADQMSFVAGGIEAARVVENASATQLIIDPGLTGSQTVPSLAFGDGDSGFFESVDDTVRMAFGGVERYLFSGNQMNSITSSSWFLDRNAASGTNPVFAFNGDDDTGIGRQAADALSLIAGGVEAVRLAESGGDVDIGMFDHILSRPKIKDYSMEVDSPTITTGALTLDLENGNIFDINLNGDVTSLTISNPADSGDYAEFAMRIVQDGTGGRSITWPASVNCRAARLPLSDGCQRC